MTTSRNRQEIEKAEHIEDINSKRVAEFFLEIAKENIPGYGSVFKFGRNSDVTSTEEVVWDYGGDYTFLTSAEQISIVSTNANDNIAGTGARTLIVYGLDNDFNEQNETITLTGTTPVITTKSYRRFNRMLVLTSGSDSPTIDANEGTITATSVTTATVQAQILPRNGQTLMAVYTIPAGKTGYVTGIGLRTPEGKSILVKAKVRNTTQDNDGSFSVKYTLDSFQQAITQNLAIPLKLSEKTDMCFTAKANVAVATPVSASFGIILVDN